MKTFDVIEILIPAPPEKVKLCVYAIRAAKWNEYKFINSQTKSNNKCNALCGRFIFKTPI